MKLCSEVFINILLHRSALQAGENYSRSERNVYSKLQINRCQAIKKRKKIKKAAKAALNTTDYLLNIKRLMQFQAQHRQNPKPQPRFHWLPGRSLHLSRSLNVCRPAMLVYSLCWLSE